MIKGIDNQKNKEKIAIVVVGYNRINSISRLMKSLVEAEYSSEDVPLVISIDCSGNQDLYRYVRDFSWPYGEKYVNIHETRLGLKNHIFQCADLTEYFKAIILLEDDLLLSPSFYNYAIKAVEKYGDDDRIAEIALYKNDDNGYAGFAFEPMQNGSDVFLWQDVCTSGEVLTHSMWSKFRKWQEETCTDGIIQNADMPVQIKGWGRAWSKPYNAYVVSNSLHIVFPYIAVSTNFGDAGEHSDTSTILTQVGLMYGSRDYIMRDVSDLVSYDLYTCNEDLYKWLDLRRDELCLDIYGQGRDLNGRRYLLSPKTLPYKIVRSFGLTMRPIEMNVKYGIEGKGLFLYDTTFPNHKKIKNAYTFDFLRFFNHTEGTHHIWRYAYDTFKMAVKRKIFK